MDKLLIRGGRPLQGEVRISGAKNAALPELCAALLTDQPVTLLNVPRLQDVATMVKLVQNMGVSVQREDDRVVLDAGTLDKPEAPYDLVKTMRASVLALGPLLARFGRATVSLPGGCAIGSRPVDQHIKGLQQMGAVIDVEHGYMIASLPAGRRRLRGASIRTDMVTVTGTENFLMAATLAEGETVLENAAMEPEIGDLAEMLIAMGAQIEGHGTSRIRIQGVERLHGCTHQVVADRIEAGTFLLAAAITRSALRITPVIPEHLGAVITKLEEAGCRIEHDGIGVTIEAKQIDAVDLRTQPFPGFPTDLQAPFMSLLATARGTSVITENIFENRLQHVAELQRMGAAIRMQGNTAFVEGVARLSGAPVQGTDLRASAAMVLAGLAADGITTVRGLEYLDRGYAFLEDKLNAVGAQISRINAA